MTAGELRQASGEMRRLAEAATSGPWEAHISDSGLSYRELSASVITSDLGDTVADCDLSQYNEGPHAEEGADAYYIAAWHPAVALAVANWLDTVADACTSPDDVEAPMSKTVGRTIAHVDEDHAHIIARAFLGTTP